MSGSGEMSGWRQAPSWLKLLLIVSLALNVAVIGMIGGTAMRGEDASGFGAKEANEPGLDRRQSRILRMVPEGRRDIALTIMQARSDEYAAAQAALKKAQMDLVEALRAEPFDEERVKAALTARREASGTVWGIGYEQLMEIATGLDTAERGQLADSLEERTKRWMARQQGQAN